MAYDIPAWFQGKTVDELEAIEVGGRVLIPDALEKRGPKGDLIVTPVLARVPTAGERAKGRADAVKFVVDRHPRQMGKDPEKWTVDRAREIVGVDIFEDLDTYGIVSHSLFDREVKDNTPQRYMLLDVLWDSWPKTTIAGVYARLDFYLKLYNPQLENLTEAQMWAVTEAIARVRNIGPLVGIAGSEQPNCIVHMAVAAWSSRTPKSPSPSTETST